MTVQIDIQRTGFPVKIGAVELWFDSSLENLRNFFNVEEIAQKRLEEAREKAEHIHFPKGIENYSIEDFEDKDIEKIDAAFDVNKEFIAAQYDILFGDGSFKKVYKEYPDVWALGKALVPIGEEIANRIEEQEKEREHELKQIENEILNKKNAKRK